MGRQDGKMDNKTKKQMTEEERAEAKAIYDQIPDSYEEWEEQRKEERMEYAKQYQKNQGYTLSLLAGAILFFNAFQQMQKIRVVGMDNAGTGTIVIMIISLVIGVGLLLYASHLRKLRYKEYMEMMKKQQSAEEDNKKV